MKSIVKYIILCGLLLSVASLFYPLAAQDVSTDAIKAYQEEDYEKAIELLEKEVNLQKEKGYESANLYYNLGNAYFRDNEVAKAILNYERALLIDPGDRDIRHNLKFARTKIEDKIEGIDPFFLQSWFDSVQNLQSSNAWAKLSVFLFLIFIASLSFFFFSNKILIKKITFYTGLIALAFVIFANIFSYRQKSKIEKRNTAIIMAGAVSVTNSPDENSKELFILHAGSKIKINKKEGNWMEIEIDNGNVGWIMKDKLEVI